jgi:isopentenyl-diphosphate Delta-isomerase
MPKNNFIQSRKEEHLRINLEEDVKSGISTGLERFALEHCALPEIDMSQIDTACSFLGHSLDLPLIISSMTGGSATGDAINIHLAEAAQHEKVAMGLGSQRLMLDNPNSGESYKLRKYAPDIPIFGNIGAVQLNYGCSESDCLRLVESVQANGLILHLNPLQEALQPEGETKFSGLLNKIEKVCKFLRYPVIVKEVGWGISAKIAKQLIEAGVSAIDIAGAGGTSWSQVEANRNSDQRIKRIALNFKPWGIPTVDSLIEVRKTNKTIPVIASGGILNGIEIAKCVALGSNLCGMAGRLIKAGSISTETVIEEIDEIKNELRIAMFASGAINLNALSKHKIHQLR